eukprot:403346861
MEILDKILASILKSFKDKDQKVQAAGYDLLYNIIKICKEAIVFDDMIFKAIFDAVCNGISDQLSESKEWAKQCNYLLQDVVYNSCQNYQNFNLSMFMEHITEKIINAKNNEFVMTMLKWIELVHNINNIPILNILPELLPRLLVNLSFRSNQPTKSVEYREFKFNDYRTLTLENHIIDTLLSFLLRKQPDLSQQQTDLSKIEALIWLRDFLVYFLEDYTKVVNEYQEMNMSKFNQMVQKTQELQQINSPTRTSTSVSPFIATQSQNQNSNSPQLQLNVVDSDNGNVVMDQQQQQQVEQAQHHKGLFTLQSMAYTEQNDQTLNDGDLDVMIMPPLDAEDQDQQNPINLEYIDARMIVENNFEKQYPAIIRVIVKYSNLIKDDYQTVVAKINETLLTLLVQTMTNKDEFQFIFNELKKQYRESKTSKSKEIILNWLIQLFKEFEEDIIEFYNDVFDELVDSLSFSDQLIVDKVLELLSMLSKQNEKYLRKTVKKLTEKFYSMEHKTQEFISKVVLVLCQSISDERVFVEFAKILKDYNEDLDFVEVLIEYLTFTLANEEYLKNFRFKLQGKQPTDFVLSKEVIFEKLFIAWSYNTVATLTLCLISRNYELAYNIIFRFANISIDKQILTQFAQLIQMIEKPSLTFLRLELLNLHNRKTQYLIKTLQGILMILPISKAFHCLKLRIECSKIIKSEQLNEPIPLYENDQTFERFYGCDYDFTKCKQQEDHLLQLLDDNLKIMIDFKLQMKLQKNQDFLLKKQQYKMLQKQQLQQQNNGNPQSAGGGQGTIPQSLNEKFKKQYQAYSQAFMSNKTPKNH